MIELGTVGPGADRIEELVPATAARQQCRCGQVLRLSRGALISLLKGVARCLPIGIRSGAMVERDPARPVRQGLVEGKAELDGDLAPGVDVGRMEPLAAEIDRLA